MGAVPRDIEIEQGSVFEIEFIYKRNGIVQNISGWPVRMQVRRDYDEDPPLLDLTVGDGITLDGALGLVQIKITAVDTAALPIINGVYDVEIVPEAVEADARRVLAGRAIVTPETTRA